MGKIKYTLALMLLSLAVWGFSQTPTLRAKLYPDSIGIGDRFTIEVNIDKDLTQVIEFPQFKDGKVNEHIELVVDSPVDTVSRDGRRISLKKKYVMTIFDEGNYSLGKLGVMYIDKNVTDTLYTSDSLLLFVSTIPIDTTTQKIYDIKPPIQTPVMFVEYGGYLLIVFFFVQIIWAIIYIIVKTVKKRNAKEKKPKVPSEPPHVIAIRELEKLAEQKLWQNHRYKLYYTRLTDIIREYIELRYGVGAMEMTSDEISDALSRLSLSERSQTQIRRLLTTADYVKFAKYEPSVEDNEMSYSDAYYFIEDTKYIRPVGEEKKDEEEKK